MSEFGVTNRGAARATEPTAGPYLSFGLQQQIEEIRRAAGKEFDLPSSHLLVLDRGMRHDVKALEDSAFLLTIAWPEGGAGH